MAFKIFSFSAAGVVLFAFAPLAPLFAAESSVPIRSGPEAAREQLRTMKVADGLEVTLFASEPQVRNPANMDIDHRGRVWITEGANYRLFQKWGKLRPEGDRIVILEDANRDGAAEKETTFYQGNEINTALGICVLGERVIVSCSPNVFIFTDANHDDRADGPPVKFFTGIKGVDHDHGVHAFVFGPDGKLYFNFGNDGRQIQRPDGTPVKDLRGREVLDNGEPYRQGMVFRCNPDGSDFEVLGHNFRNNYEVAVDSFGTLWQSDNDDDGNKGVRINYVMEFGNFGYKDEVSGASWGQKRTGWESEIPLRHWHLNDPGVVPNLLQTGAGSPTGILLYEGQLLPEVFRGQMIHCDAGPRAVRAYPVAKDGAGYSARMVDLLTADDTWYRPSDVCAAPDGSVYITDWNDAGVGGHYMADQKLETMTGRVFRVAPKGSRPSVPKLDLKTDAGCIAALQSANLETRYLAWTALHARQGQAEKALVKLWKTKDPRQRARALHLLARIPGKGEKYVGEALRDSDSDIRITGLRIGRQLRQDVVPLVEKLARDASPQVRRECAIALREMDSTAAPRIWAELARKHDGKDRWYLEALGIGADQRWDACLEAYASSQGASAWTTPAGREIIWRSRGKQTPKLLVAILKDKTLAASERDRFMRAFDFQTGPEKEAALVELLTQ